MRLTVCTFILMLVMPIGLTNTTYAQPEVDTMLNALENSAEVTVCFGKGDDAQWYAGAATHIADGYYLTARHIIEENGRFADTIYINGEEAELIDAGVIQLPICDWALLKSDLVLDPTYWTDEFKTCEWAFRIGNDMGDGLVPAIGLIGNCYFFNVWSATMSIRGGASGGGIYNESGELIGIVIMMPEGDNSMLYFITLGTGMFNEMRGSF